MKASEKADYFIEKLGKEGAWVQACDEFNNSETDEERDFYSGVMDLLKEYNPYK